MSEEITLPRFNLKIKFRGGYLAGSRGRLDRKGDNWDCECVNCGETFTTRKKLRFHYTECQFFEKERAESTPGETEKQDECVEIINGVSKGEHLENHDVVMQQNVVGLRQPEVTMGTNAARPTGISGQKVFGKDLNCNKYNTFSLNETALRQQDRRCGQYEVMANVCATNSRGVTERDKRNVDDDGKHDVIVIDHHDNISDVNDAVYPVYHETGKIPECKTDSNGDRPPETCDSNDRLDVNENNRTESNNSKVKHPHTSDEIEKDITSGNNITSKQTKRKFEVLASTSSIKPSRDYKRLKTSGPLYKSLYDDILQEELHNKFDRVRKILRPYRCSQCGVGFKYKCKLDIHEKFAHRPTDLLISDIKSFEPESEPEISDAGPTVTENRNPKIEDAQTTAQQLFNHQVPANNDVSKVKHCNYPCDFCQISFRHFSRFKRHVKQAHAAERLPREYYNVFKCSECNTETPDKHSLLKHFSERHFRHLTKKRRDKSNETDTINEADDISKSDISNEVDNNGEAGKEIKSDELDGKSNIGVLDVKNIMQHLKTNLLCLQSNKSIEVENFDQSTERCDVLETASKRVSPDRFPRNFVMETAPRDYYNMHVLANEEPTNAPIARKTKFSALNYYSNKDNFEGEKNGYRKQMLSDHFARSRMNHQSDRNEQPLDLSVSHEKAKSSTKNAHGKTDSGMAVMDRKPSDHERAVLLEYYKNFLHEYGIISQPVNKE